MFGNLKLGVKLIGGFGAVLILFACVIALYQYAVKYTLRSVSDLVDVDIAIAQHSEKTEILMLQCRKEVQDFLTSLDLSHPKTLNDNVNKLIREAEIVDSLAKKTGNEEASDKADLIIISINAYRNDFQKIVQAMTIKGLDDNSGLKGRFNKIVSKFMNDMGQHEVDEYYIELLNLRRYESEYMFNPTDEQKRNINKTLDNFDAFTREENVNPIKAIIIDIIQETFPEYRKSLNRLYKKGRDVSIDDSDYQEMQENLDEFHEVMMGTYFRGSQAYALDIRKNEKDYLLTGDLKYVQSTRTAVKTLLDAFANSEVEEDSVKEANGNMAEYIKAFDTLVDVDKKIKEILASMNKSVMEIGPLVAELNANASKISEQRVKNVENHIRKRATIAFVIGMVAIALGIVLSLVITRGITRPIIKTVEFAENMAKGDLSQQIDVDRKDEIGILSEALNGMVLNLKNMFVDISSGVEDLTTSSSSLSQISQKMLTGAEKTEEKSNLVSEASEKMNSNINSVASTIQEAAASMTLMKSTTDEMNISIGDVSNSIEGARKISETAVQQANSATSKIEELGIAALDIGKVTDTITDISEQTNLLALNATIESARAGEAGKGFAVVAGEIKTLAQQTAEATKEISSKIAGVQNVSKETMSEINEITGIINKVNEIIISVASSVDEQSETTREISLNMNQMSDGIQDINEMMVNNSAVTGQIAQDISEVNQAAGEMSGSSNKVNESSEDLMGLAGRLKEMVGRFVL